MNAFLKTRSAWWLIFVSSLLPFVNLAYRVITNDLGVEPGKTVLEFLGETAIAFLLITLALTPLKTFAKLGGLIRHRRMIGLYCLFYATLHVVSYGLFIVDWSDFIGSLYKRPYVTLGAIAFAILIILGVTSPKAMLRKLGKKWKSLHRSIYVCGGLVVAHVWWQSRSDYTEAFIYAAIFVILMLARAKIPPNWPLNKQI